MNIQSYPTDWYKRFALTRTTVGKTKEGGVISVWLKSYEQRTLSPFEPPAFSIERRPVGMQDVEPIVLHTPIY